MRLKLLNTIKLGNNLQNSGNKPEEYKQKLDLVNIYNKKDKVIYVGC